jgi:hypothetical protein
MGGHNTPKVPLTLIDGAPAHEGVGLPKPTGP